MLTEEIEKEIYKHVVASVIPCDEDFDPQEDGFPFSVSIVGVIKAAAAIAKRLGEGVVWQDTLEVSFDGICRLYHRAGFRRRWAGELNTDQLADLDGQLVEVIVKIVEGAKDVS